MIFILKVAFLYIYLLIDVVKIFGAVEHATKLTITQILEYSDRLERTRRKTIIVLCIIIVTAIILKLQLVNVDTDLLFYAINILFGRQMIVCYCVYRLSNFKINTTGKK